MRLGGRVAGGGDWLDGPGSTVQKREYCTEQEKVARRARRGGGGGNNGKKRRAGASLQRHTGRVASADQIRSYDRVATSQRARQRGAARLRAPRPLSCRAPTPRETAKPAPARPDRAAPPPPAHDYGTVSRSHRSRPVHCWAGLYSTNGTVPLRATCEVTVRPVPRRERIVAAHRSHYPPSETTLFLYPLVASLSPAPRFPLYKHHTHPLRCPSLDPSCPLCVPSTLNTGHSGDTQNTVPTVPL